MNFRISNIFKGDKVIWMVFFLLCMVSVVEVFSATSQQTYRSQNYIGPIAFHATTIVAGFVAALIMPLIPCRYFKLFIVPLLFLSILLLIVVLIDGETINGANRSLNIFGRSFQPSELAKGTVVLATAQVLAVMQRENGADLKAFKYIMAYTVGICVLIGLENLSTAILLFVVVFLMMIIGRVPYRQLLKLFALCLGFGVAVLTFIMVVGHQETQTVASETQVEQVEIPKAKKGFADKILHRADTWKGRILSFNKPDVAPKDFDIHGKDAQVAHANIAIATSNIIGVGPGKSVERDYLPQAYSDFIFAIIIEELGIVGAGGVIFLYIVLLYRGVRIANRCENYFPAFLVMGLTLLLVVQAIANMAVAVGLGPVTGQPLPLISKGGSSTVLNGVYIGAILSVSRTAKIKKVKKDDKKDDKDLTMTK